MTKSPTSIYLREWESAEPDSLRSLRGLTLPDSESTRRTAQHLAERGMLRVTELRQGLAVESFSFVGRVRVGDLTVTVQPKIAGTPLLRLLRYAYALRDLSLVGEAAPYPTIDSDDPFQDLLIYQLASEVRALLAYGLRREYVRTEEATSLPRGRVDMNRLARNVASGQARLQGTLPCVYYERSDDTPRHRALLRGLEVAERLASESEMQAVLRRLAHRLGSAGSITASPPGETLSVLLRQVRRSRSRLTAIYDPALTLIDLLVRSHIGPDLTPEPEGMSDQMLNLPGFLFDMNRFFQRLIERFLTDYLPVDYEVRSERGLRGIFAYQSAHNPHRRHAPTPRPDFAVAKSGMTLAILDAKYRDLWGRSLPREMLYQLSIYAAFGPRRSAVILYPTVEADAHEQRVDVRAPDDASHDSATVSLRPVNLIALAESLRDTTSNANGNRHALAWQMVFGDA